MVNSIKQSSTEEVKKASDKLFWRVVAGAYFQVMLKGMPSIWPRAI
jgi:hypothetical protein